MSNVDSCIKIAIVPDDPSKPLIGPFILSDGDAEDRTIEFAHKLGYKDEEFELRQIIYPEDY
jgi:hypothetical protein